MGLPGLLTYMGNTEAKRMKLPRLGSDDVALGMLIAALLACLMALAFGCATQGVLAIPGTIADKPGLEAAKVAIWTCYGRTDTPPAVRIVEGKDLNCTDPNSGQPGFNVLLEDERNPGKFVAACRNGFTFLPTEVMVGYTGQPWSESTLAHEYQHAKQARMGIVDSHHRRPEWEPGGEVERCNAKLEGR